MSPGVDASMSNTTVGKADRTGYNLKALQEIRNTLRPFATENGGGGGSPSPTLPKDPGPTINYHQHLYHPYPSSLGYNEVRIQIQAHSKA